MRKAVSNLFYSNRLKYVGIACILWGIISFVIKLRSVGLYDINMLSGLLSWGFCFLFFSKEKRDDERIHMLKFHALAYGVPMGLMVTHLINYFYFNRGTSQAGITQSISAFQSFAIMLGFSLVMFYVLKFRDQRV